MSSLAAKPDGVLVPVDFLHDHGLAVGDTLDMKVLAYGGVSAFKVKIVGTFEAFPTWYGDAGSEGALFVGNLYYLFQQMGTQLPHNVLLRMEPGSDYARVIEEVRGLGVSLLTWEAASAKISEEQCRPERRGLFGILSIGVLAAAFLTVIGFSLYAVSSFRRRFIELGVLHTIGIPAKQMATVLAWELGLLLLVALALGTGLGVGASHVFITRLQAWGGPPAEWPLSGVRIDWLAVLGLCVLCGLLQVVLTVGLRALYRRLEASRAIRAAETA
jgi:putative ABC transport system permease protein